MARLLRVLTSLGGGLKCQGFRLAAGEALKVTATTLGDTALRPGPRGRRRSARATRRPTSHNRLTASSPTHFDLDTDSAPVRISGSRHTEISSSDNEWCMLVIASTESACPHARPMTTAPYW